MKRKSYHARLAGETARLTMLVENELDLGRLERAERGYDRREENVRALVREALDLYAPLAEREELAVRADLGGCEARAAVDHAAFVQVLLNLLENARRYAASGGVIEVSDAVSGGVYHLCVADRGPGVPPRARARIFARFARGALARRSGNPGVGLGLFLARTIARDPSTKVRRAFFQVLSRSGRPEAARVLECRGRRHRGAPRTRGRRP